MSGGGDGSIYSHILAASLICKWRTAQATTVKLENEFFNVIGTKHFIFAMLINHSNTYILRTLIDSAVEEPKWRTAPTKMTSSEAFVETMVAHGTKHIFGIVGSAFMDALDIFEPAGIRFVPVQVNFILVLSRSTHISVA